MKWVENHMDFFTTPNRTLSKEDARELFGIFSWVTGKNQRLTGCGRCLTSAKLAVIAAYNKSTNDDQ